MSRKRRPSLSLITLFIILLLLFFFSGAIVDFVSKWSGQGVFVYNYAQGSEAIVAIEYELPQKLADAMVFTQPTGWTLNLDGNVLNLSEGTLNPGESVTIDYRLKTYLSGGTNSITVTSKTESGSEITNQTSLQIPDVFLLYLAELLYQNSIYLLILAIIVLVIIILLLIKGEKVEDKKIEINTQT